MITKTTVKKVKIIKAPKPETEPLAKKSKYFKAIGRRKTAIANVRLFISGTKDILVNNKPFKDYFPTLEMQEIVLSPLKLMEYFEKCGASIKVLGGGIHSQAEAVRHGLAKTLILFNAEFRKTLKKAGYLTRDPRMRERKKFGLRRARRAPQWAKR